MGARKRTHDERAGVRSTSVDGDLVGKLGGDERLIFKLQPKVSANEELQELLEYGSLTYPVFPITDSCTPGGKGH